MIRLLLLASLLTMAACQGAPAPKPPSRADLAREIRERAPRDTEGQCWTTDEIPAVIETVTEQVRVPADTAGGGAGWRTETQQKIVQDRRTVWFRIPCPEDMTGDFTATLQRALKARGLYLHPLTGHMDAATGDAVRRYQAPLGLDSAVLSLAAARDLGIVAADLRLD